MSSSPILPHTHPEPSFADETALQDEERKGLLAGIDATDDIRQKESRPVQSESWPSPRVAIISLVSLVILVLGGVFALAFFYTTPKSAHPDLDFQGNVLRSNGTHNFKRTVVIVSIDGLRCVVSTVYHRTELTILI